MRTAYTRTGAGETLVLIHGVGLDRYMWDDILTDLSPQFDVIAYDILGHGQSPLPSEEAQLAEYVDQLLAVMDDLHIKTFHLLGFSMGALIAQAVALKVPDRVTKLILLNSVYQRDGEQRQAILERLKTLEREGLAPSCERAIQRWFMDEPQHPRISWIKERMLTNDIQGYTRSYRRFALADVELPPQQISNNTLVMTGELDPNSTPAMSKALASQLQNAELVIIPRQRHMMPITAARQVAQKVIHFVSNHDSSL